MTSGDIVSYGSDPLQKIKVFEHNEAYTKNIIFIHGGAWRDPNCTFDDFEKMTGIMKSSGYEANLFGINYRLSPKVKHSTHLVDVLLGIRFLVHNYYIYEFSLVGHSVGATLALQFLNYQNIIEIANIELLPFITEDPELMNSFPDNTELVQLFHDMRRVKLTSIGLIDGIYDTVELIKEFGDPYKEFIDDAFLSKRHYEEATQLSSSILDITVPFMYENVKILILHSVEDELLSPKQTQELVSYLKRKDVPHKVLMGNWGKHEEVYNNAEVAHEIMANL